MTDLNAQETRATVRVDKVSHFFGEGGSRNQVLFDNSIEIEIDMPHYWGPASNAVGFY